MRNIHAEHEERINAMKQHLKNVRQELNLTQVSFSRSDDVTISHLIIMEFYFCSLALQEDLRFLEKHD